MDAEGAVRNVKQKNGKRVKPKSKKVTMNHESARRIQEADDIDKMKVVGSARVSEKDDNADRRRDHKRGQEKKKNKGSRNVETDIETGSKEVESTDINGEHGSKLTMGSAERREKKKKREKNKNKNDEVGDNTEDVKMNGNDKCLEGESVSGKESCKKVEKERKKQKLKTYNEDVDIQEGGKDGEVMGAHSDDCKIIATERVERMKKKKDKKKNEDDDVIPQDTYIEAKHDGGDLSALHQDKPENVGAHVQSTMNDGNATKEPERKKTKKHKNKENYKNDSSAPQQDSVDIENSHLARTEKIQNDEGQRKKKTTKIQDTGSYYREDNEDEYANKGKKRKTKIAENGSSDAKPNKSNKKVRFSGEVEVFPLPDDSNAEKGNEEDNLVRGKRFTSEEDEIVKDAVSKYIEEYELGDEGLNMVLNCSKHPKLKGCWKKIGSAIPYRPYNAIYFRARVLFMRSETRKWTQEEYDMILKHHEEHGSQWRALADELGKHAWHVKDTYRRIKLRDLKKGNWSQEEYQKLFDLVNTDLQLKVSEEKKSKHGMLRDNICWSAISDELSTRNQSSCCLKWYKQLTSPMVAEGVWADSDDYRLLTVLYDLDATCLEDVDWEGLVENRSGDVCRKRWNQMVLHIGHHGKNSFAEQVEILAQRYCPHLLDAREAWDSKPRVP